MLSQSPRIVLFKEFISEEERKHLLALAEGKAQKSTVVDNDTGKSIVSDYRTGYMVMLRKAEDEVVHLIEDRIARITFTRIEQGEPLQIIGYKRGEQYKPHNDWFDPAVAGTGVCLKNGGQRIKTAMIYLRAPKKGGETEFVDLKIKVKPELGACLIWDDVLPDGNVDPRVLHAGRPVTAGEKTVATRWIRQRAFDGSENALTPAQLNEKLCSEDIKRVLRRYRCSLISKPVIVEGKILAESRVFSTT